jgi:hypothetical protein
MILIRSDTIRDNEISGAQQIRKRKITDLLTFLNFYVIISKTSQDSNNNYRPIDIRIIFQ